MPTLISLCQNAALLAIGVMVFSLARPTMERWPPAVAIISAGTLFAGLTLLSMMAPLVVRPGFILDARNTLVALAAVFAGPLVGLMAAVPATAYRIALGGPGAWGAPYGHAVSVLLGWALYAWAARRGRQVKIQELAALGAAISIGFLPYVFLIQDGELRDAALRSMPQFSLSIVFGLCAFGMLILNGDRRRGLQLAMAQRDRTLRRTQGAILGILRQELLSDRSLEEQLKAITRIGAEALGVDVVSIWRFDEMQQTLSCLERWNATTNTHEKLPNAPLELYAQVRAELERNLTLRTVDARADPLVGPYMNQQYPGLGPSSLMIEGIRQSDRLIGHISVASLGRARNWTIEEQGFARSLADLVGLALLQDQLDRKERTLQRNQLLLVEIVRDELLRKASIDDILDSVCEGIGRTLGIDRTAVWRLDFEAGERRRLCVWDSVEGHHIADVTVSQPLDSPLIQALMQDLVVTVEDVASDVRLTQIERDAVGGAGGKSLLWALISAPDAPIGILHFGTVRARREWTIEDRALARSLADLVAFAFLSSSYREAIAALDLVDEAIYVHNRSSEIIYANRAAKLLNGSESRPAVDLERLPSLPAGVGASSSEADAESEVSWSAPGGAVHELAIRRTPLPNGGLVTMLRDITDQRARQREQQQLKDQLQQAAKMEAIGRFAGGIAHDFNNMIGAIIGFSSLLLEDLPTASAERRYADRIKQVCDRAKDVVKQILSFSRTTDVDKEVVELRAAVEENTTLVAAALAPTTRMRLALGTEKLPALLNRGQLHQVLLNLCVNANDALDGRAGEILVTVDRLDVNHPDRLVFSGERPDDSVALAVGGRLHRGISYCVVRVSDTGGGMDQATLDRVFEPFFTTKHRGRGTGLGLAVVHGIVGSNEGAYLVRSQVGVGSEFSVYFPLADEAGRVSTKDMNRELLRGQENVLIVDDESDITDSLGTALERLGYDVTCSNDPMEALAGFEADPDAWDVVISDRVMPHMAGCDLIARIKLLRPRCTTILCTGFADTVIENAAREARADAVLLKPVEPQRVAGVLREQRERRLRNLQAGAA